MKKALVIIASIIFIVLISLVIAWGAEYHLRGTDWPENSCMEQYLTIAEQRPWAVAVVGEIDDPTCPGHGTMHVQAYDPHIMAPDRRAQGYAVHHEVHSELLAPDVCEAV